MVVVYIGDGTNNNSVIVTHAAICFFQVIENHVIAPSFFIHTKNCPAAYYSSENVHSAVKPAINKFKKQVLTTIQYLQ
jgi:hypothetical protein